MRNFIRYGSLLTGLVLSAASVKAQVPRATPDNGPSIPEYPVAYTIPTVEGIKSGMDHIKDRMVAHSLFYLVDTLTGRPIADYTVYNKHAAIPKAAEGFVDWSYPNGVALTACEELTEVTGDTSYRNYAIRFFDNIFRVMPYFRQMQEKGIIKKYPYQKMVNMRALDHCGAITAALIGIQKVHPAPSYRSWIDTVNNYISNVQHRFSDGTIARERPQPEALWADDMYMCIPFLAQYGSLTGENKYYDDAVKQAIQLSERLFDSKTGLFDHGWNLNSNGTDPAYFWGRANGWATVALADLLSILPKGYPGTNKVLDIYKAHVKALVEVQDGTGLWHNLLNRPETYLETSASALFVLSMAKGLNEGWLGPAFGPATIAGWNGVASKITSEGLVEGIVEGTTFANDNTYYFYRGTSAYTGFYGTVMRAGAEMIKLLKNPKFVIVSPKPNAVNSAIEFRYKADPLPR